MDMILSVMPFRPFQHPDFCPTVVRRRVTDELLTLLLDTRALSQSWDCSMWASYFPNTHAYRSAMSRLRKQGLIAYRREGGKAPVLIMTAKGEVRARDVCRKSKPWPPKWRGTWFLLSYDVPEVHRTYREELRAFLKEKRMGCLHKSVWITPHDIRPAFDDLVIAAGLSEFAFLLEAKTVLGQPPSSIVNGAWDMETLRKQQRWYLSVYRENLKRATSRSMTKDALHTLIREEQTAFSTVMSRDPLLPKPLWPETYVGEEAWTFHRAFLTRIADLL